MTFYLSLDIIITKIILFKVANPVTKLTIFVTRITSAVTNSPPPPQDRCAPSIPLLPSFLSSPSAGDFLPPVPRGVCSPHIIGGFFCPASLPLGLNTNDHLYIISSRATSCAQTWSLSLSLLYVCPSVCLSLEICVRLLWCTVCGTNHFLSLFLLNINKKTLSFKLSEIT